MLDILALAAAVLLVGATVAIVALAWGRRRTAALAMAEAAAREAREGARQAAEARARDEVVTRLEEARRLLERVDAHAQARAAQEAEVRAAVARVESVLAGHATRGAAGEHALAAVLDQLPAGLLVRDARLDGGVVEFALRLPDGRLLAVDAKWPGGPALAGLDDPSMPPGERQQLAARLQRVVEARAAEAARYVDPPRTLPMAVVAVPDAVHARVGGRAHAAALRRGVVVVPFGMAVPYLLSVWLLWQGQRPGEGAGEAARLARAARVALAALDEAAQELDGRMARAMTQLDNSRRALRGSTASAQEALRDAQAPVDPAPSRAPAPATTAAR